MPTDDNGANQRDLASPRRTVYAVPRRYDLATLFAVSLAYALLFGLIRALGGQPEVFAVVVGFITCVGLAQAILFRGKAPRAASIVAGSVCFVLPYLIIYLIRIFLRGGFDLWVLVFAGIWLVLGGAVFGYVVGVLIGGVFLVAHALRQAIRRTRGS